MRKRCTSVVLREDIDEQGVDYVEALRPCLYNEIIHGYATLPLQASALCPFASPIVTATLAATSSETHIRVDLSSQRTHLLFQTKFNQDGPFLIFD